MKSNRDKTLELLKSLDKRDFQAGGNLSGGKRKGAREL